MEVGKADLPPDLVGGLGEITGRPPCRLLGQAVRCLVADHTLVSWDLVDHDFVLSGHGARAHLRRPSCPLLAWAQVVRRDAPDRCLVVREDSILRASLPSRAEDPERLVNSEGRSPRRKPPCCRLGAAEGCGCV